MIDFFDMIMEAITWTLIALGLTVTIVFLGMVLNAFVHIKLGWW